MQALAQIREVAVLSLGFQEFSHYFNKEKAFAFRDVCPRMEKNA